MSVIDEIAAERRRQVEVEEFDAEHDDEHEDMSLARVAAVYAYTATLTPEELEEHQRAFDLCHVHGVSSIIATLWPDLWDVDWFKPQGSRRDLIRAGALIVAEIERIDRDTATEAEVDHG
jgi:hypothetical protein